MLSNSKSRKSDSQARIKSNSKDSRSASAKSLKKKISPVSIGRLKDQRAQNNNSTDLDHVIDS